MLPFVGVDGEGGDITVDGFRSHHYTMLRAGQSYTTGPDWFRFLLRQPKKHIYVAYMFDYDVTMMCRDLPEDLLRILVTSEEIIYKGLRISYRPRKEFTIRGYGTATTINDVGTFFQCKFVTALERWQIGTQAERDMIDDGKSGRNEHRELTDQIVQYNALECDLIERLMDKFRRTCIAIGYMPQRWQGPGQLAKAMLKRHEIPLTRNLPEPNLAGVMEAAQAAYYGGRFETSVVGPVSTPVDGWDINSAYPYACTHLPCLEHVEWKPSRQLSATGIYRVSYTHRKEQRWYGLPHRTSNGRIIFPRNGAGWYWGIELLAAQRLGADITIRYGFEYVQHCSHRRFDFIPRLYSIRRALGKSEAGIALKLALNSLYGVFAQSVGNPPYANPINAGMITARTRAQLIDAISHDPESVYMLATDGIYCAPGLPLTPSEELGGWDRKHFPEGMHIVMPGVYFAGDSDVVRTRGVSFNVVTRNRERLIQAYTGDRGDEITVPMRSFIPLRLAVSRGRYDLAGQWVDVERRISYDWSTKRMPGQLEHTPRGDRTMPYDAGTEPESVPYDRLIGGNLIRDYDRLETLDLPDWADTLTELP